MNIYEIISFYTLLCSCHCNGYYVQRAEVDGQEKAALSGATGTYVRSSYSYTDILIFFLVIICPFFS